MQTTSLKNTMIYDKELLEHVKWLYKPPETHWCSTIEGFGKPEKDKKKLLALLWTPPSLLPLFSTFCFPFVPRNKRKTKNNKRSKGEEKEGSFPGEEKMFIVLLRDHYIIY